MANILRDDDGKVVKFAWPGCYTVSYLAGDGDMICSDCVQNEPNVYDADDYKPGDDPAWRIDGHYVNWEGPPEVCANCNKEVESEYGDPDSEERD